MTLSRNQFAFREDEESSHVYLIREGEIEMSKKLLKENKESINMSEFLMHKQSTNAQKRKELKKPVNNAFGLYQKGT